MAFATIAAAPLAAKDIDGYVFSKKGASPDQVWVERQGESTKSAVAPGTRLEQGDIVVASRAMNAQVTVELPGGKRETVKRGQRFAIPARPDPGIIGAARAYLSKIGWAMGMSDGHQQRRTAVGRRSEGAGPPTSHPLVGTSPQVMIEGLPATLVWCGLGSRVTAQGTGGFSLAIKDYGIARIAEPAFGNTTGYTILGADAADHLHIPVISQPIEEIARPDWLEGPASDAGSRAAWGYWLVTEGPAQYRLAGFSLLDDAASDAIEAAYYRDSLATCEDAGSVDAG